MSCEIVDRLHTNKNVASVELGVFLLRLLTIYLLVFEGFLLLIPAKGFSQRGFPINRRG
jgi:hypothetical protein